VANLIQWMNGEGISLLNPQQNKALNEWCLSISSQLLPHLIGRLYIDKLFNKESMDDMRSLVNDLKQAFEELLNENNWMDPKTKANAISKLKAIAVEVASPDFTFNNNELEIYSNDVRLLNNKLLLMTGFAKGV
jgi:predicted metalloendopeptidase